MIFTILEFFKNKKDRHFVKKIRFLDKRDEQSG